MYKYIPIKNKFLKFGAGHGAPQPMSSSAPILKLLLGLENRGILLTVWVTYLDTEPITILCDVIYFVNLFPCLYDVKSLTSEYLLLSRIAPTKCPEHKWVHFLFYVRTLSFFSNCRYIRIFMLDLSIVKLLVYKYSYQIIHFLNCRIPTLSNKYSYRVGYLIFHKLKVSVYKCVLDILMYEMLLHIFISTLSNVMKMCTEIFI
jgi:hypothetical protein